MNHPDVTRYAFDDPELTVQEIAAVDEHLHTCAECRDSVLFIRKFNDQLSAEAAAGKDIGAVWRGAGEVVPLQLTTTAHGDVAVIRIEGSIFLDNQGQLVTEVDRSLSQGFRMFVLDLGYLVTMAGAAPYTVRKVAQTILDSGGSIKLVGFDYSALEPDEQSAFVNFAIFNRLEDALKQSAPVPLNAELS